MEHLLYFLKDLKQVGAVAPSSKFLAKDLVTQLQNKLSDADCQPLNILEVGAGTGSLTKQIAKHLRPQDSLDIVEIHKKFYQIIGSKYRHDDNIRIHHADILNFHPQIKYDFIFSSLPYENMPEDITKQIWEKKLNLCLQKAYISYFKYLKFGDFKSDFEEEIVKTYKHDKKIVFLNIPPAKIYTLEINQTDNEQDTIKSSNVA
ncbi:class I SAM-dependent methyltransferase [Fodinibius sp.]|uniref:class I SAM-dependent methyltransferase n=1 Tax=Fodinibius sp. TaxID=1872440 RepID=UPI002ACD2DBE|nr:rRNA adenine N-6-methyltransferase family protein [Fodinibius sp.]MDZ7658270.1 rRNA adenine N-6-methyltransferase family protein [Fodinibius sp.]